MASGWNGESSARAGGHGFLLGDEGSAYWIGRAAVRAALRFQDQMGGSEAIHRAVIQAAGRSLDALIGDICTHPAERDRLTALAPAVTALAAEDAEAGRSRSRPPGTWPAWPDPSGAASGRCRSPGPGECSAPRSSGTGSPS